MKKHSIQFLIMAAVVIISGGCSRPVTDVTVIKQVNLVPMTSNTVIPDQTVVVQGTKIIQIGDDASVKIPRGATIIEGKGQYLMPGLADMHTHYLGEYERDTFFNLYLKNGVTTVRVLQSFPNDSVLVWSEKIKKGKLFGPNLFTCGLLFNDLETPSSTIRTTPRNYDVIKLYSNLTSSEFSEVMKITKEEKIYTIGHIPYLVGLDGIIEEGMNEVAHTTELLYELVSFPKNDSLRRRMMGILFNNWVREYYTYPDKASYVVDKEKELDVIVSKVKKEGIFINTTLVITHIMMEQLYQREKFLQRPELKYTYKAFMPGYLDGTNAYTRMVARWMENNKDVVDGDNGKLFLTAFQEIKKRLTQKLNEAGVILLLATDSPTDVVGVAPGYSMQDELQILAEYGFTPYEVLKTGTYNAGIAEQAMTGQTTIGTIEVNKQADFILMPENPLENVGHIKGMSGMMISGRWLTRAELDALPTEH